MATTNASFDDPSNKKSAVEKGVPDENASPLQGVSSLLIPIMSEESILGNRSLLRARLKKLGETTKSKLVPNSLKLVPNSIPRYLEVEISPLLLCGVFTLSDLSRTEMERGYVKTPRTGSLGSEISLSLPVLHLQSNSGKRKKIIGWDKSRSEPLRVFLDTESKKKVFLEYGVVGQNHEILTPLGTVEIPVKYKTMGPTQIHFNLKKRPLWPTNNSGGIRFLNSKFRLSANSRLSLQLSLKEAHESDLLSIEFNTHTDLSMLDEDDFVETTAEVETNAMEETKTQENAKPQIESNVGVETRTRRTPSFSNLFSLFGCFCGNNDKEADQQNTKQVTHTQTKEQTLPNKKVICDLEENSLLETATDIEAKPVLLRKDKLALETTALNVEYTPANTLILKHSCNVKLPMSFSSTTGSLSDSVSFVDTEGTLQRLFCYPLLTEDDEDIDNDGDDDSSVDKAKESKYQDGGDRSCKKSNPESVTVDTANATEKPRTGELSLLKQFLLAFKFRSANPRTNQSTDDGDLGVTDSYSTWKNKANLVFSLSEETRSVSTAPVDGCLS